MAFHLSQSHAAVAAINDNWSRNHPVTSLHMKCAACGRTWRMGETLLLGRQNVCPHARDCNEKKERDKLVRDFKRNHRVSGKALRKNLT